jgi:hypothetical protein
MHGAMERAGGNSGDCQARGVTDVMKGGSARADPVGSWKWTPVGAATVRERPATHLRLNLLGLKHTHDITLLGDDVLDGRRDMLRLPKPSCAAMACPSFTARLLPTHPIKMACGVSLKIIHDSLRRRLRLHHCMHVIASYVGRQEMPSRDAHKRPESPAKRYHGR